jgi:hypothetical protein
MIHNIRSIFALLLLCLSVPTYAAQQDPHDRAVSNFHQSMVKLREAIVARDSSFFQSNKEYFLGNKTDKKTCDWFISQIIYLKQEILPHLTRPFERVRFDASGSLLIDEKEQLFYDLMKRLDYFIAFRCEPGDHGRYNDGNTDPITFYHSAPHELLLPPLYKRLNCSGVPFQIQEPINAYKIRDLLIDFELQGMAKVTSKITAPILILPSHRSDFRISHEFLTVHILDLEKQRVLASVLINSWEDSVFSQAIFDIINGSHNIRSAQTAEQRQWVQQSFPSIQLSGSDFNCSWNIPTVDCSNHIQTAIDDRNCQLYAYVTTLALTNIFRRPNLSSDVLTLARQLFENPQNQAHQRNLSVFIRKHLIAELSQFFNSAGNRRSDADIKQYFMRLRWDLSSQWLELLMNKELDYMYKEMFAIFEKPIETPIEEPIKE